MRYMTLKLNSFAFLQVAIFVRLCIVYTYVYHQSIITSNIARRIFITISNVFL